MRNPKSLLKRLSVLGPAEVAHRVREVIRIKKWERAYRSQDLAARYSRLSPQAFEFCRASRPQLPSLPFAGLPEESSLTEILKGAWPALDFPWRWSADAAVWNQAPDTGRRWPSGFFHSIDYRAGNPTGDVRVAWEPARLQQLVALARIAREREEHRGAALSLLEHQLQSFAEANPPARGIHYISAMECGLRILSVTHALDLVREELPAESPAWPAGLQLVASHADMVADRLSLHSSTGNHTVSECAGLVYAGVLFPELPDSRDRLRTGLEHLRREARRQVLTDGGGMERSPWYHLLVVDLLGLVEALLEHHDRIVPEEIAAAVTRGRRFLNALAEAPEELPPLNDADNGFALGPDLRLSWNSSKPDPGPLVTFAETGLTRVGLGPKAYLLLDHGPLANGPLYAHGHADACSVYLAADGGAVLSDPGTFMYTGGPEWRRYFRSTAAHNTVRVDGRDQARQETAFQWSRPYTAGLESCRETEDGAIILTAAHDGYAGLGVRHRRILVIDPPGAVGVFDLLEGSGSHTLELHWHVPLDLEEANGAWRVRSPKTSALLLLRGGAVTRHAEESSPTLGWTSSRYGHKEPANTLRAHYAGPLPHRFESLILLGEHPGSPEARLDALRARIP